MSTISQTVPTSAGVPDWLPSPLYRMSVEEYEAMVASGAFPKRRRLHLIQGLLVEKMTRNPPHTMADELCGRELLRVLPPGWHVRTAKPIRLPGQASKPEPDRCVVRGDVRDYRQDPGPDEIALVVEVADSSLTVDRDYVARLYGPAGIPVCWIVNLNDRQVEVYTQPGAGGYASCVDFQPGDTIPMEIAGQPVGRIAVDDLMP